MYCDLNCNHTIKCVNLQMSATKYIGGAKRDQNALTRQEQAVIDLFLLGTNTCVTLQLGAIK
jgi:hypothetical protein